MQALLGLALIGGAALMGRRRSTFDGPSRTPRYASMLTWEQKRDIADRFSDLAFEAKDAGFMAYVWFDYGADDEGADPCNVRSKYFLALDQLKEARKYSRRHAADILAIRQDCKRSDPRSIDQTYLPESWGGGDDPDEKHPSGTCEELEAAQQWIQDAFHQINDAKATYERGCPGRTIPDVWKQTLSGLDKLITKQMTLPDYVDELVFRTEQFNNASENTYREIYDEADMDGPNNPKCDAAVVSYHDTLDKMKESSGAMRASQVPKLLSRCGNPHSGIEGGGEICRRFRWAARLHDNVRDGMPELRKEIAKWCDRKVPKP